MYMYISNGKIDNGIIVQGSFYVTQSSTILGHVSISQMITVHVHVHVHVFYYGFD